MSQPDDLILEIDLVVTLFHLFKYCSNQQYIQLTFKFDELNVFFLVQYFYYAFVMTANVILKP